MKLYNCDRIVDMNTVDKAKEYAESKVNDALKQSCSDVIWQVTMQAIKMVSIR